MRLWAAFIAGLMLAGCTTGASLTPEKRFDIACTAYAGSLEAIATQVDLGNVSREGRQRVDTAVAVIAPYCEGTATFDPATTLARVEQELVKIITEQQLAEAKQRGKT